MGKDGKTIHKTDGWISNIPLNWTSNTLVDQVYNTTAYMTMISSVGRDIMTAFNCGEYPITSGSSFIYGDQSTFAPKEVSDKYENKWNSYIVAHSNAYGMAYSDAAHAKVQYELSTGTPIEIHIFGQNDSNTVNYYSKTDPGALPYNLGIGGNSSLGKYIMIGEIKFPQDPVSKAYGGKITANPNWQKFQVDCDATQDHYIWIKASENGSVVGGDCFVQEMTWTKDDTNNVMVFGSGANNKWKDSATAPAKPE